MMAPSPGFGLKANAKNKLAISQRPRIVEFAPTALQWPWPPAHFRVGTVSFDLRGGWASLSQQGGHYEIANYQTLRHDRWP